MPQAMARLNRLSSSLADRTVLVVEDDPMVLRVATRVLQAHGFTVIDAASGEEAIQALDDPAQPLDAVLTDLNLPGMAAKEMLASLRAQRPGVPVIMMSGYGRQDLRSHGVDPSSVRYLAKPFTADRLLHTVAEVVEAASE